MLAVKKNKDDYIYSYVDYRVVDKYAQDNRDGEYCYVRDLWIHPDYRRKGIVKLFLKEETEKHPTLKWIYYRRRKYGGKMKIFDIRRMSEI